jgi:hypothetical protein
MIHVFHGIDRAGNMYESAKKLGQAVKLKYCQNQSEQCLFDEFCSRVEEKSMNCRKQLNLVKGFANFA